MKAIEQKNRPLKIVSLKQKVTRVEGSEQGGCRSVIGTSSILDSLAGSTTGQLFILRRDCCRWRKGSNQEADDTLRQIFIVL